MAEMDTELVEEIWDAIAENSPKTRHVALATAILDIFEDYGVEDLEDTAAWAVAHGDTERAETENDEEEDEEEDDEDDGPSRGRRR